MPNEFVDYLNSMNSADANGKGALAEWQVQSPYFDKMLVRRSVSDFLRDKVTDEPAAIILTGHAGDGKTSLLAQLLKDLLCLPPGEKLKRTGEVTSPDGIRMLYVKDMSELTKDEQESLLQQVINAPSQGQSAVLVSNTGPLINTAQRLMGATADEAIMALLERMDTNGDTPVYIADRPCYVINMARLDNVHIAGQVLSRMLQPEMWASCAQCEVDSCPINNNIKLVASKPDRVAYFAEAFYRHLQEHDNRLTVRQIVAHLSFAMTGNLTCAAAAKLKAAAQFDYHFANLFFGYVGLNQDSAAKQIKAIADLEFMGLDGVSLKADYRMFVQQDYSEFDADTAQLLQQTDRRISKLAPVNDMVRLLHRRAIRRFYLLCSLKAEACLDDLLGEVYSPLYPIYLRAVNQGLGVVDRKQLQGRAFNALYTLFTGMPPTDQNEIPLTVRRDGVVTQYVQLLKGSVPIHDISIQSSPKKGTIGQDVPLNEIVLKIKDLSFPVNFPLLEHFRKISDGAVATALAPSLSHGIDRLKANLMEKYSHHVDEDQKRFSLLLQTSKGAKRLRFELVGNKLYIE